MRWIGKVFAVLLPLAILSAAGGGVAYLYASAPSVERTPEARRLPIVEALPVKRQDLDRVVDAFGSVVPAREVQIFPEISGRILRMHPSLEPGGVIHGGETLVEIDPEEYELALDRAQGALAEAEAAFEVERGRQLIARREWELYGQDLPNAELGQALALREPQLRQAEAKVTTAKSMVKEAELNLKRTKIASPFDVLVIAEDVDIGQYVSPGKEIAALAGADTFWISVSVPADRLEAIVEASRDGTAVASVFREVQGARSERIPARLVRNLGRVDPEGRMAQLLVEVDDPLGLNPERPSYPILPLNTYVRVELAAGHINDTIVLPRRAYRENDQVWVADIDDKLQIRTSRILWRQEELLAVEDVFAPGDRVVISPVGDLLPRMEVRVAGQDSEIDRQIEVELDPL